MTSLRAYEVKGHMKSLDEQLISASRTLHIDLCEHTFGCTSQLFLVRHECPRMAFLEVILFICPVQRMTSLSECATYITLHECPRDTFPWPKGSGPWLAWNVLKKPSSFREAIFFMCPFKRISSFAYRKILFVFFLDFLSLCLPFLFQRKHSLMCPFTKKKNVFFESTNTCRLLSPLSSLCLQQSTPRVNVKREKKSPGFPPLYTPRNFVYKVCPFFWFGPVEAQVISFTCEYVSWIFHTCRRAGQIICLFFSWGKTTRGSHTELCEQVSYDINGWYQ